jgi:hypothetical protein
MDGSQEVKAVVFYIKTEQDGGYKQCEGSHICT